MRLPIIATIFALCLFSGCSKSPIETGVNAANAYSAKLMAPLAPKDASHQAEGLIRTLDDRPECQLYIDRLREAGHGPPAAGATQYAMVHADDAAGKAGCVKSD